MPEDLRQIQWREYGETVLHPLALLITLLMVVWVLATDRRYLFLATLIIGVVITSLQRIVIGSFDFNMLRLLLLGILGRAFLRNDMWKFSWSRMDSLFILYTITVSVAYIALRRTPAAFTNRLGFAFDAFLAFFMVRLYFRTVDQVHVLMRGFAVILLVSAVAMTVEQLTRYNVFSVFGGVRAITPMRLERLRAQGAFPHAIMAGTFGAAFLPLAWALRGTQRPADRRLSNIGIVSALVITYASSSSGPVLTLMATLFGIFMWHFRQYTRLLVRLSVLGLIALHLVMKAPVWHLISRVDIVGGSTGWHRYALIDRTIRNFREWALLGVHTTGHWGWGLNDITNMYVLQAVQGGFFGLLLFVLVISHGFRSAGSAAALSYSEAHQKLSWAWGVVLFAHCVSFLGASYFGQMTFFWYLTLAVLCTLPEVTARETTAAVS